MTRAGKRLLASVTTGDVAIEVTERRVNGGPAAFTACFGVVGTQSLACFQADELDSLSEAVAVAMGVIDCHEGTARLQALAQRWGARLLAAEQGGES